MADNTGSGRSHSSPHAFASLLVGEIAGPTSPTRVQMVRMGSSLAVELVERVEAFLFVKLLELTLARMGEVSGLFDVPCATASQANLWRHETIVAVMVVMRKHGRGPGITRTRAGDVPRAASARRDGLGFALFAAATYDFFVVGDLGYLLREIARRRADVSCPAPAAVGHSVRRMEGFTAPFLRFVARHGFAPSNVPRATSTGGNKVASSGLRSDV